MNTLKRPYKKRKYPVDMWAELYHSGISVRELAGIVKSSKDTIWRELRISGKLKEKIILSHAEFENRFVINSVTNCWEWVGLLNNKGYGVFVIKGHFFAHRYSYEYYNGSLNGLYVLHKCDNPKCCNPEHLFLGTQADNLRDMSIKGRRRSPGKLPPTQILEIRELIKSGEKYSFVANIYNVSERTIRGIIKGEVYKSI